MESATVNTVTTIKFSPMEFDLVRLTFFKRNTQEFLLLKEVLSFVRSYVQSVEITQAIGERNIYFTFFYSTCSHICFANSFYFLKTVELAKLI